MCACRMCSLGSGGSRCRIRRLGIGALVRRARARLALSSPMCSIGAHGVSGWLLVAGMAWRAEARQLLEAGVPGREVAARVGVSHRTVQRLNAELRGPLEPGYTDEQAQWAREMGAEGCPVFEVAASLGVHRATARRLMGVDTSQSVGMAARRMMNELEEL